MGRYTVQDLRIRCAWAGVADGAADQLLRHYTPAKLDEVVDCVWLIGLYINNRHGEAPPGHSLGSRARAAAEAMPEAAATLTSSDWRSLP